MLFFFFLKENLSLLAFHSTQFEAVLPQFWGSEEETSPSPSGHSQDPAQSKGLVQDPAWFVMMLRGLVVLLNVLPFPSHQLCLAAAKETLFRG